MPPRAVVTIRFNHFAKIAAQLPDEADAIVQEHALRVEAGAKIDVPVDTGTLKNSIQTEPERKASWVVYTNQDYAIFQEYGTVKMGARPYMTPAAERVRPLFVRAMQQLEGRLK